MILLSLLLALTVQAVPPQKTEHSVAADAAADVVESLFDGAVEGSADDGPTACVRDGNTPQINACAAQDRAAEEARMERYFQAAMTRASEGDDASGQFGGTRTQQAAWLEASQTAWKSYAGIRCAGVFDQWKDGTIRTVVTLGCEIEAMRQRTHDIWVDHLTYVDSTPPVLPEPVGPPMDEHTIEPQ